MLSIDTLYEMKKEIEGRTLALADLPKEKTVLVIVDMVNGFVHEGILSSPRVKNIIGAIKSLCNKSVDYNKIFFIDEHEENSVEFKCYSRHCEKGSAEAELIPELKEVAGTQKNIKVITKNSTNGFHAPEFKKWLGENQENVENYIIVGCEADICVSHFAITLKTYFNQYNLERRIIVPKNSVETYDYGSHEGDLMKLIALYEMQMNGIEIVDEVL